MYRSSKAVKPVEVHAVAVQNITRFNFKVQEYVRHGNPTTRNCVRAHLALARHDALAPQVPSPRPAVSHVAVASHFG